MLSMNNLRVGTTLSHESEPYVVTEAQHVKMGRGGAVLRTKIKNLINGNVLEITYKGSDKIADADLSRTKADFLYGDDEGSHFMQADTYEQYMIPKDTVGDAQRYLKEGLSVDVLLYNDKPVSISLPNKVELTVTEAPPGIRGDTAQGGTKLVTVETGAQFSTPLFIDKGEVIRVNTETGEYVERAK